MFSKRGPLHSPSNERTVYLFFSALPTCFDTACLLVVRFPFSCFAYRLFTVYTMTPSFERDVVHAPRSFVRYSRLVRCISPTRVSTYRCARDRRPRRRRNPRGSSPIRPRIRRSITRRWYISTGLPVRVRPGHFQRVFHRNRYVFVRLLHFFF